MRKKVKFAAAAIGILVALSLPVLIIVWYTMTHDLPRIGPFEIDSPGSAFLWMFVFVLIYGAILAIPITIVKRKRGESIC